MSAKKISSVSVSVAKNGKVSKAKKAVAKKSNPAPKGSAKKPKLIFKAIEESDLKLKDKAFLSLVIGQFALLDAFELPLAVSRLDDGTACPSFEFENIERGFYALHKKLNGRIKIELLEKQAQNGVQWAVKVVKTKRAVEQKFVTPKAVDKKLESSKKRVAKAKANKAEKKSKAIETQADKIAELKEGIKKSADFIEVSKEKRAALLKQGDGKKANELLAQETASAHLVLQHKIEIAVRQAAPELAESLIKNIVDKVYSAVK